MKQYLLFFALAGLIFASCKKEDDPTHTEDEYHVMMVVEAPTANAVVNINESMAVKVNFSRGAEEIIHHVKIVILDSTDQVVETLLEDHAHVAGSYVYDKSDAWTPTVAGTFTIKAMSHDMEDNVTEPVETTFTVQ